MTEGLIPAASLPEASHRVVVAGEELGVSVVVYEFPEGTKTSQDAAAHPCYSLCVINADPTWD